MDSSVPGQGIHSEHGKDLQTMTPRSQSEDGALRTSLQHGERSQSLPPSAPSRKARISLGSTSTAGIPEADGSRRAKRVLSRSRFGPSVQISNLSISRSLDKGSSQRRRSSLTPSTSSKTLGPLTERTDSPADLPTPPKDGPESSSSNYHHIDFSEALGDSAGYDYDKADVRDKEENKISKGTGAHNTPDGTKVYEERAPEERITKFALRLASMEKAASGIGALSFLWATVIVLTSTNLNLVEFGVVFAIILAQGARIFNRSHEIELRNLSAKEPNTFGQSLAALFKFKKAKKLETIALRGLRSISRSASKTAMAVKKAILAHSLSKAPPALIQGEKNVESVSGSVTETSPDLEAATVLNHRQKTREHSSPTQTRTSQESTESCQPALTSQTKTAPAIDNDAPRSAPEQRDKKLPHILRSKRVRTSHVFSRLATKWLYFLQLISAFVCLSLSVWRVTKQDFGDGNKTRLSLYVNVFYALAILEASWFLLEKCYQEYQLTHKKLLLITYKKLLVRDTYKKLLVRDMQQEAQPKEELRHDELEMVKQFFHYVYAKCLQGSVFDGLDLGLVSYSISCLQSEEIGKQHGGARLLNRFVSMGEFLENSRPPEGDPLAADALRQLGTTPGIIERLVEMLSWNDKKEYPLLYEVSTIVCRLVIYNRNCSRIVAVPGAVDAIVSLLWSYGNAKNDTEEEYERAFNLRLTGLRILSYLCRDHKNSLKVGEAKGLLSILTMLIAVRDEYVFKRSNHPSNQVKQRYLDDHKEIYKTSLQVLRLLAATSTSGQRLRHAIADNVACLTSLRALIEFGEDAAELQWLSADILYHVAMEDDLRERVGSTGGVIRCLFILFAKAVQGPAIIEHANVSEAGEPAEVEKAGQTLARLFLRNERNCRKLLAMNKKTEKFQSARGTLSCLDVLILALDKPVKVACSAAEILRSLMKYADQSTQAEVSKASVNVLITHIKDSHRSLKEECYQASLGLLARTMPSLDTAIYEDIIEKGNRKEFVEHLMRNLKHAATTKRFPRIRRFSVELIVACIEKNDLFMETIQRSRYNLRSRLENTLDATSEVENFCLFSGLVGYTRHEEPMEALVQRAMQAVDTYYEKKSLVKESLDTSIYEPL